MDVAAIVPAAGRGRRMGRAREKAFLTVAGKPLLVHTLSRLLAAGRFTECVVAVPGERLARARRMLDRHGLERVRLVAGGRTRAESVLIALEATAPSSRWALVHDGARPLVSRDLVRRLLRAAGSAGGALCAMPSVATVKESDAGGRYVRRTVDRRRIWLAQTPQVFRRDRLLERYRRLGDAALSATDEAALFDGTNVRVKLVQGDPHNVKITTPADLRWFEHRLNGARR